jgi:hypothetical protein
MLSRGEVGNFVAVILAIQCPPEVYIDIIHAVNTLVHVALIALWAVASLTTGFPNAPVLIYNVSPTEYDTDGNHHGEYTPYYHMKRVVRESMVIPIVWLLLVGVLLGCDISRIRYRWCRALQPRDNYVDARWHTMTIFVIPPLVIVATTLSSGHSTATLAGVGLFTCISSILALSAEELHGVVVSSTVPGPRNVRDNVVSVMISLFAVTVMAAGIPICSGLLQALQHLALDEVIYPDVSSTQIVVATTAVLLMWVLAVIQLWNHCSYDKLHHMRPDRCSFVPLNPSEWDDRVRQVANPPPVYIFSSSTDEPPVEEPAKFPPRPTAAETETAKLYWVEPVHERGTGLILDVGSPYRDVGAPYRETTTMVVDIPGTSPVHVDETSSASESAAKPVVFDDRYWTTPVNEPATDADFELARRQVGLLVRWRRYYVLAPLINILLIETIVEMADLLYVWA